MAFLKCLKTVCLPHTVLKLWQVCTSKARENFPADFGNHLVSAAYVKIWVDSIPQTGNVAGGAATSTGGKRFRTVFQLR